MHGNKCCKPNSHPNLFNPQMNVGMREESKCSLSRIFMICAILNVATCYKEETGATVQKKYGIQIYYFKCGKKPNISELCNLKGCNFLTGVPMSKFSNMNASCTEF